jgi:hypothetical protein
MKERKIPAPELLGSQWTRLEGGLVYQLWPTPPAEFEWRACAHVSDSYSLYQFREEFILEFEEWCGGSTTYRALRLAQRPSKDVIGQLFFNHTQAGRWCFEMQDFDELRRGHSRRSTVVPEREENQMWAGLEMAALSVERLYLASKIVKDGDISRLW